MKVHLTILFVSLLLAFTPVAVPAQSTDEELAVIYITGQNRNRTVVGSVNEECGGDGHSAPFGNWGVASNYGNITDTDQFRGDISPPAQVDAKFRMKAKAVLHGFCDWDSAQ